MRIGQGFDVHNFTDNRPLILGGTTIPFSKGLAGHSDADVLIHALLDALLGAMGKEDIGSLFPDTDRAYKNVSSLLLLKNVVHLMEQEQWRLGNADIIVMAQEPKLAPYRHSMKENIAKTMQVDLSCINIKATTTEQLGFIGRKEGIASSAVVLLFQTK